MRVRYCTRKEFGTLPISDVWSWREATDFLSQDGARLVIAIEHRLDGVRWREVVVGGVFFCWDGAAKVRRGWGKVDAIISWLVERSHRRNVPVEIDVQDGNWRLIRHLKNCGFQAELESGGDSWKMTKKPST